jgi:hypothetical protein
VVIVSDKATVVKLPHPSKVLLPILISLLKPFRFSAKVTRLTQFKKASSPTVVAQSGKTISAKLVHPLNAPLPIDGLVIFSFNGQLVISVRFTLSAKAYSLM